MWVGMLGSGVLLTGVLGLLPTGSTLAEQRAAPGVFPRKVTTIEGQTLDVQKLARQKTLVVITLKATWCPVCQVQLMRIKSKLPEIQACGVGFLVLAPGPRSELESIKERIGFPYPFIEDVDLAIAKRLGLQLAEDQISPAIFILDSDLSVAWMQRGRNASYFGDPALLEKINCGDWIEARAPAPVTAPGGA